MNTTTTTDNNAQSSKIGFGPILRQALENPELIADAVGAYPKLALVNQLAATIQLKEMGIPLGHVGTYDFWKGKNRFIRKGHKAIRLFGKFNAEEKGKSGELNLVERCGFCPTHFAIGQTKGKAVEISEPETIPFSLERAAKNLGMEVSDLLECAEKILNDGYAEANVETESVVALFLMSFALGVDGAETFHITAMRLVESKGLSDKSAKRAFKTAHRILAAGRKIEDGKTESTECRAPGDGSVPF